MDDSTHRQFGGKSLVWGRAQTTAAALSGSAAARTRSAPSAHGWEENGGGLPESGEHPERTRLALRWRGSYFQIHLLPQQIRPETAPPWDASRARPGHPRWAAQTGEKSSPTASWQSPESEARAWATAPPRHLSPLPPFYCPPSCHLPRPMPPGGAQMPPQSSRGRDKEKEKEEPAAPRARFKATNY